MRGRGVPITTDESVDLDLLGAHAATATAAAVGAEAEACRERLKVRNIEAVVLPLTGNLWTVAYRANVFPDRAAAEAALRTVGIWREGHVDAHWRGGYIVLPRALAASLMPEQPAKAA